MFYARIDCAKLMQIRLYKSDPRECLLVDVDSVSEGIYAGMRKILGLGNLALFKGEARSCRQCDCSANFPGDMSHLHALSAKRQGRGAYKISEQRI